VAADHVSGFLIFGREVLHVGLVGVRSWFLLGHPFLLCVLRGACRCVHGHHTAAPDRLARCGPIANRGRAPQLRSHRVRGDAPRLGGRDR